VAEPRFARHTVGMNTCLNRSVIPLMLLAALASPGLVKGADDPNALKGWKVVPLANDFVELYRSSDPANIYCYTPGLAVCPNGRLIATMELGARKTSPKPKLPKAVKGSGRAMVFTSDDRGKAWTYRTNYHMTFGRPFVAGKSLYILGERGDLVIIRSDDWGETWSEAVQLTEGHIWHQSACNVHYARGCVYLVMERRKPDRKDGSWGVSELAPVLMRAKVGDDLLKRESWTFASDLHFCDAVSDRKLEGFGIPFFNAFYPFPTLPALFRGCAPIGWLETNVVQFVDPDHTWFDPSGHTFHLWMRAHTGMTNLAALCKVVEKEDGSMQTQLETVPSGKKCVYVPCPGGQMRFHILYDEKTKLYWLLSSQSTDSMTRPDRLPGDRYGLPDNERHRLQLHFSKNCVDWCFAGLVAVGASPRESRHYASMVINGDDLHILSRSGDARAANAHNGNIITFHTIPNFRRLAY
jgi:hypothetical protein